MGYIQKLLKRLDKAQQKHEAVAFTVAVFKKYSDDNGGRTVALITYYGFLAIFPLLLVLTTLSSVIIGGQSHLATSLSHSINKYFPLLGNQLSMHVHKLNGTSPTLIIGILLTIYGARGVANAFMNAVQDVWGIPQSQRPGFPKNLLKSVSIVVVGGGGFILASISAGLASSAGRGLDFRLLSLLINLVILYWLFSFLINFSLPRHISMKQISKGAIFSAVGLIILETVGSYIISRELKKLDSLYSYYAIALGLLFWIYLQVQVLYYAMQISIVGSRKLWPRSLTEDDSLTAKAEHRQEI